MGEWWGFGFGGCVISRGGRYGSLEGSATEQNEDLSLFVYLMLIMGLVLSFERGVMFQGEPCNLQGYVTEQDNTSKWIVCHNFKWLYSSKTQKLKNLDINEKTIVYI